MYYNIRKEMITMLTSTSNIREFRIERGLSQQDLAYMTGYKSRSSINKIEKGITMVTLPQAQKIADALGVAIEAIVPSLKNTKTYYKTDIPVQEETSEQSKDGDGFVIDEQKNAYFNKENMFKHLFNRNDDVSKAFSRLAYAMAKVEKMRQEEKEVNAIEKDALDKIRKLTPNNRQLLFNMMDTLLAQQKALSVDGEGDSEHTKSRDSLISHGSSEVR
jgi:transcriptional regulator with XRE-family HTH domain